MLQFILAHQMALGAFILALLDFMIAMKPDWKSNGVFHAIYLFAANVVNPPKV